MAQLHCSAQEDAVITAIRNLCREPETLVGFMTDTSITYSSTGEYISRKVESQINLELKEIKEYISLYFKNSTVISKDTIVKPITLNFKNHDWVRFIVIQGENEKRLYFYLLHENNKWKIRYFDYNPPAELLIPSSLLENNLKTVENLINDPEIIWKDDIFGKSSWGNKKEEFFIRDRVNLTEYLKHNYQKGFNLEYSVIVPMKYGNKSILEYEHQIYITNSDHRRPLKITFVYNDSINRFHIDDVAYYKAKPDEGHILGRVIPDTLATNELADNWRIVNIIMRNPDTLNYFLNDTTISSKYLLNNFNGDEFPGKIIKYIKDNFSNGFQVEEDIGWPFIDRHFHDHFVYNIHLIVLVSNDTGKKLFIKFKDHDKYYHFLLTSIYSHISAIDDFDWENASWSTP